MSGSLNKVFLMGNLTRDPEIRTAGSSTVGSFGIAVNRKYRDKDGAQHQETTFVDCEAWGKTAETIGQYLKKGRPILVEGRLKLDQWQDKDGSNRSKLKVVVDGFQFVDSNTEGGAGGGRPSNPGAKAGSSYGTPPPIDDDIPF